MTLKTIRIDEIIYKKLFERKKKDESISDFIKRLLKVEKDLPVEDKNVLLEQKLKEVRKKIEHYDIFNLQTWNRVAIFLQSVLNHCWQSLIGFPIPEVFIDPSNGSYDIHWDAKDFELLLIIPPDLNELVHISGEKFGSPELEIEARINFKFITEWIIDWLKKTH